MEIDWDQIKLTDEIIHDSIFLSEVKNVYDHTVPVNITQNWLKNDYDIWHKHLIPLEYFTIPFEELLEKHGLIVLTPTENPETIQKYYQDLEHSQNKVLLEYEQRVEEFNKMFISDPNYFTVKMSLQKPFTFSKEYMEASISNNLSDLRDREELIIKAKDKYDIRWYLILHSCWQNAYVIYRAIEMVSPEIKWNIIKSPSHSLVTSGTIEQLKKYLYENGPNDFYIAEPTIQGIELIRYLMPNPETWVLL